MYPLRHQGKWSPTGSVRQLSRVARKADSGQMYRREGSSTTPPSETIPNPISLSAIPVDRSVRRPPSLNDIMTYPKGP
jgi:hypothetical protein